MTIQQQSQAQKLLTEAYKEYQKGLRARAFFKVNDPELSADLVQNTFMKTWNYLMKGGKIETMKTFLYHVLNNLIVDQYRKHKTSSLDVLLEKGFEPETGDFKRIFDVIDGAEACMLIEQMPTQYRKVLHMRYVEDMSLDDISENIGTSKKTIAVQVHRGMKKLQTLYHFHQSV